MDSGWLKVLNTSGRPAFAAFAACLGFSIGADQRWLRFGDAPAWTIAAANVGVLLFGALVVLWLLELASEPLRRSGRRRRVRKAIIRALEGISREEREVLWSMVGSRQKSITAPITHDVIGMLVAKGLLRRSGGVGDITAWVYLMPEEVWDVLIEAERRER